MSRSLSNLVKNLAERVHKTKCKYEHNDKNCEAFGMKCKDWDCCLERKNSKVDLIEFECL